MSDPRRLGDYVQHLPHCGLLQQSALWAGDGPQKCTCGLDALLAEAVAPQPEPDEASARVQIMAGSELAELVRLVRFTPGQVSAFLHGEFEAQQLLWRWFLKWRHADPLVVDPPLAPKQADDENESKLSRRDRQP